MISVAKFLVYPAPGLQAQAEQRGKGWFELPNGQRCSPKPHQVYFHPQSSKPYIPEVKRRPWWRRLFGKRG